MPTMLTLEPDVERLSSDEVRRTLRPLDDVVNDAIRRGLGPRSGDEPQERYQVKVHKTKLRSGILPVSLNRLADEPEDVAISAQHSNQSRR